MHEAEPYRSAWARSHTRQVFHEGIVAGAPYAGMSPSSKLERLQETFLRWSDATGRTDHFTLLAYSFFVAFFLSLAFNVDFVLDGFFFAVPPNTMTGFSGEKASSMRLLPLVVRMTSPW